MADDLKATPRKNALLGLLADALGKGYEYSQYVPLGGGPGANSLKGLLDTLGFPGFQRTVDRMSYGEPLTTGRGMTTKPRADTMDALLMAPRTTLGLLGMGASPAGNALNPLSQAAIVWHGSPHKFDRFDASKIGTGEGAQAYGHGLYLAESPDVAKSYQIALSADRGFSFGGKDGLTREQVQDLVNAKYGGGYLDGVTRPSGIADSFIDDMVTGTPRPDGTMPRQYKPGSERARVYNELRGQITHTDPGSLYKVDLPDTAIARMLDWDKPLSQQSLAVQQIMEPHVAPIRKVEMGTSGTEWGELAAPRSYDPTGGELLRLLAGRKDTMDAAHVLSGGTGGRDVSEKLRRAGIPGIRYLDGGSRSAGAGTSNYVIFPGEENLLTILERNGVPLK